MAQILVVEDELTIAEHIRDCLESMGYQVPAIARTKSKALESTAAFQPDLVLVDIHLETDLDGIEAANEIRTVYNIPVVYLTAYADAETVQLAYAGNSAPPLAFSLAVCSTRY